LAQDDPVALADQQIDLSLRNNESVVAQNVETALEAGAADLAKSFAELAGGQNMAVPEEAGQGGGGPAARKNSPRTSAPRLPPGLVTGTADDVASLSGTVAGDLFVFGDIRDVVREGKHLAFGEETDHLVLSLAAAGLAVTAATYLSAGGAAPLRAGLS